MRNDLDRETNWRYHNSNDNKDDKDDKDEKEYVNYGKLEDREVLDLYIERFISKFCSGIGKIIVE